MRTKAGGGGAGDVSAWESQCRKSTGGPGVGRVYGRAGRYGQLRIRERRRYSRKGRQGCRPFGWPGMDSGIGRGGADARGAGAPQRIRKRRAARRAARSDRGRGALPDAAASAATATQSADGQMRQRRRGPSALTGPPIAIRARPPRRSPERPKARTDEGAAAKERGCPPFPSTPRMRRYGADRGGVKGWRKGRPAPGRLRRPAKPKGARKPQTLLCCYEWTRS